MQGQLRADGPAESSWIEQGFFPSSIGARKQLAFVEPILAPAPKLDSVGGDSETGPERRSWNRTVLVFLLQPGVFVHDHLLGRQRFTLCRRPRPQLTASRAALPVRVRLGVID